MKKICKHCGRCLRLYLFYAAKFRKTRCLYCETHGRMTDPEGTCPLWQAEIARYDLSGKRFQRAESDLRYLLGVFRKF